MCSIVLLLWKKKRMPRRHPYDLPQECAGDVYRLVGLGARTWHYAKYPLLFASDISMQMYIFYCHVQEFKSCISRRSSSSLGLRVGIKFISVRNILNFA